MTDAGGVQAEEARLQTFGERDHGGSGMVEQVAAGLLVEGQRAQRHILAPGEPELGEVVLDGVDEVDCHRVVEDAVGPPGLGRADQQRHQRRLRHPGQVDGVLCSHR